MSLGVRLSKINLQSFYNVEESLRTQSLREAFIYKVNNNAPNTMNYSYTLPGMLT